MPPQTQKGQTPNQNIYNFKYIKFWKRFGVCGGMAVHPSADRPRRGDHFFLLSASVSVEIVSVSSTEPSEPNCSSETAADSSSLASASGSGAPPSWVMAAAILVSACLRAARSALTRATCADGARTS